MNVPDNLADKYKAFFRDNDAGRFFIQQLTDKMNSNTRTARKTNSLDFLSRSKGNEEALDLIGDTLNIQEAKRPKE